MDLGGSRKAMETMRAPSAICLPVRRKKGTPAQRQLSISQRRATKVSVSESRGHPLAPAVPLVLAPDDLGRVDGAHGAEDLVLLLVDGPGLEGGRGLHGHEGQDLEEVGDDHVPEGAGLLVEGRPGDPTDRVSGTSIWMWSMCSRFQIGSNSPLAKRKARMFWAASLPRKWSMRKTWSSSKTSWTTRVEPPGAGQVGAEGLLHDDPGPVGQPGLAQGRGPPRRRRGAGCSGSAAGAARRRARPRRARPPWPGRRPRRTRARS